MAPIRVHSRTLLEVREILIRHWIAGFALVLILSTAWARTPAETQNFYRVSAKNLEDYNRACQLGTVVVLAKLGEYVDIVAPQRVADRLMEEGRSVELVQKDLEGAIQRMRGSVAMGTFHTHGEMTSELGHLARTVPNLVAVESIGTGWEGSSSGDRRHILAVKVCKDVKRANDRRPEVLFFGGIHARELTSSEVVLGLIRTLVDRQGRDPEVDFLLEHRQLWFVPMLNPDGREYAMRTDIWWRKNRRRLTPGGAIGVDLNRNFSFGWGGDGRDGGSSGDPSSAIFRGDRPFSEPETQAFRRFVLTHRFVASLAYHSYGQYLIYPYGTGPRLPEDLAAFEELARDMTRVNRYHYGNVRSTVGYASTGRHDDWLYGERQEKGKVIPFEIEVGRTFFPEDSELPRLTEEIRHPSLTLAKRAGVDLNVSCAFGPGGRKLTVKISNRGLSTARDLALSIQAGTGFRVGGERRLLGRLEGLLDRRPDTTHAVSFTFPVMPDDASLGETEAVLKLRLSYLDGEPVVREWPIDVPTD